MAKTVWLVRSHDGTQVEVLDVRRGDKPPYLRGVIATIPYRAIRALGFTGLRKGKTARYQIGKPVRLADNG
jgi:hypothetical protein